MTETTPIEEYFTNMIVETIKKNDLFVKSHVEKNPHRKEIIQKKEPIKKKEEYVMVYIDKE